jgi:polyisoprenyl-teichoic acid--peptidoglycan teichoic acid transferase
VSERPPRVGLGVLKRAAIAGVLVVGLSATAVASAVLFQVDAVKTTFLKASGREQIDIPEITRAEAGDPRTFLILGSDARYSDKKLGLQPRSDTILLVRVDPDRKRIAVLSLPRDLKVSIPGHGTDKINAAYADGGPRMTVRTVQKLFHDRLGVTFPINNVINVNFGGFKRAVSYVHGVYVDVDRRYYNDNSAPDASGHYAKIDIQPGYQRLSGGDALAYVRYRHGDSDLYRAARQQDFLRQVVHEDRVKALLDVNKRIQLARIFGRYFEVDKSFRSSKTIISLIKMGLFMTGQHAPVNEVRFPALDSADPAVDTYLHVTTPGLRQVYNEFMSGKGSTNPRPLSKPTKADKEFNHLRGKQNKPAAIPGLEQARAEGENMAVLADPKLNFPFYFPTLRYRGSRYASQSARIYRIRDELGRRHQAYRLVLFAGAAGEYYGVQGMTWRSPPILDNPDAVRTMSGRRLRLYYDGHHLRLVAWKTRRAVYWVTNTLSDKLSNAQLTGIAASLARLKQ